MHPLLTKETTSRLIRPFYPWTGPLAVSTDAGRSPGIVQALTRVGPVKITLVRQPKVSLTGSPARPRTIISSHLTKFNHQSLPSRPSTVTTSNGQHRISLSRSCDGAAVARHPPGTVQDSGALRHPCRNIRDGSSTCRSTGVVLVVRVAGTANASFDPSDPS